MKKYILFIAILIPQVLRAAATETTPLLSSHELVSHEQKQLSEQESQPDKEAMSEEALFKYNWRMLTLFPTAFKEDENLRHNLLYKTLSISSLNERHEAYLDLAAIAATEDWPQYLIDFINKRIKETKDTAYNRFLNLFGPQ